MTQTVSQPRRFSRRAFLGGTGAMLVAIGTPRLLNPKTAFGALEDFRRSARRSSTRTQIDSWLAVHGDGTVTVFTGKVELGTGVMTTTMQLVADELDVALSSDHGDRGRHVAVRRPGLHRRQPVEQDRSTHRRARSARPPPRRASRS